MPLPSPEASPGQLCIACAVNLPAFSGARSYGYYRAELSRMVQELKFGGRRDLVGLLGPLLARTCLDTWSRADVDLIVAVPLHPTRRRERGYNQAELLARSLAREAALPFCGSALRRIRATVPQVGLSDPERSKNVHGAFCSEKPDLVKGKRILLVDDVMTTGSTLQSAAEALSEAGALRVFVLTAARAVPGIE